MYFEEFDFNDLEFNIIKNKIKNTKCINKRISSENFSMNNINTSFPVYMQGNKKKFLKVIEILLINAINETDRYGCIKVQMNFQPD
jgi:hypothetical protein